ncbi:MAG TPA: tetratricopeptide repeat protein [Candidatus Binatia bacterium]|nr:tetratricopeptide repeat protein [Candidatus Binatia bacterium]
MSSHYEEEAEVEQLRRWWRDNWKALAAGLALGLAAIFGWQRWQEHQTRTAVTASAMYEDLKKASAGKPDEAKALAQKLTESFGDTPYAAQAQLLMAQQAAGRNDWADAQQRLQWVADRSADDGLKKIARLRLARVLWQQDKPADALKQLDIADDDAFAPLYLELRGDITLAQGDRGAARTAYEKALKANPPAAARDGLQHKLDDLADAKS